MSSEQLTTSGRIRMARTRRLFAATLVVLPSVAGLQVAGAAVAGTSTPVLAKKIIGYSVQHRPIVAYHLGNPAVRTKSLILGQMHGDEHAGVTLAKSIIHGRVSVEGINLWVIPTMNPDGDALHTRQNSHKVDLNRNWPDHWRHLTGQYYSGTGPLSEPETRAMHSFLKWLHPHYLVVLHQPLDGVDTTDGGAIAKKFVDTLARNLHLAKKAFNCWSACYGSMTGWYTTHKLGIGETIEFGWHPTRDYLEGTARRGIIDALHGWFGPLARHDPRYRVTVTRGVEEVSFTGWASDIDNRAKHLTYKIFDSGRLVAQRVAWAPSPAMAGHGIRLTLRAAPGWHKYCTYIVNVAAGTHDPVTCDSAWVRKPPA